MRQRNLAMSMRRRKVISPGRVESHAVSFKVRVSDSQKRRRYFVGGSDARIIMGNDEEALVGLWREKRGEVEPKDLSGNLVVQLGVATEDLNRRWYEDNTGQVLIDIQRRIRHPILRWMAATWMAGSRALRPSSRPNSCCLGRFPKRPRLKSTCHSSNTIC